MRKSITSLLSAAAVLLFVARLDAQQLQYTSAVTSGDAGGDAACDVDDVANCGTPCCDQSGFISQYENTFFRFHHGDGVDKDQEFDFEYAPRATLGYVGPDGLGIRTRIWYYDHENGGASIESYNIDIEFFEEIALSCCTSIEVSGGIRINSYEEEGLGQGDQEFEALGGIIAIEVNRTLAVGGAFYARLREGILMDDWNDDGDNNLDTSQMHTEIGFGYKTSSCHGCAVVTALAGVEWQNWQNYDEGDEGGVGFGGFVLGLGIEY